MPVILKCIAFWFLFLLFADIKHLRSDVDVCSEKKNQIAFPFSRGLSPQRFLTNTHKCCQLFDNENPYNYILLCERGRRK